MGQALVIAKYMVKEYVVNLVLKRRSGLIATSLVVLGIIVFLVATLLGDSGGQGGSNIARELRAYMLSIGLNKNSIMDIGSLAILLTIICGLLVGGRKILVSEAEYELVLSQPISMPTYIAGRMLHIVARSLMAMPVFFWFVPLCMDFNNGNPKAFLIPLSITLAAIFGNICMDAVILADNVLNKLGYRGYLRIGLAIYLVAGLVHSFETGYVSPLLTTPFRSLMELLVYPFTLTETLADILAPLCKTLVALLLMSALTLRLSRYVDPEDIMPLERVIASKQVEGLRKKHRPLIVSKSPSTTVWLFIFKRNITSFIHVRNLFIALTVTATISFIVKTLVPVDLLSLALFAAPILITMLTVMFVSVIGFTLAEDIRVYWIYRVYLVEMESVAKSLLAKYVAYLTELLLVTAIAYTILTNNILYLLYPLTVLPSAVITGFLMLATLSYFMSKKKIVKHLPTGMNIVEELVAGIISAIVAVSIAASLVSFNILLAYPPIVIIVSTATSLVLALLLYTLLAKILSKIMQTYDIIT